MNLMIKSEKNDLFCLAHTLEGNNSAVYSIAICKEFIYSASADKQIARWNIKTGEIDNFSIKVEAVPYTIKTIPKYNLLIIGLTNGKVYVIDILEKKEITCLIGHSAAIFSIESNLESEQLYIGDKEGGLSAWSIVTWEKLFSFDLNCGKIRDLKYIPNQHLLLLAKYNGDIGIYETNFFNEIKTFEAHTNGVSALCFDETKQRVISGGKDAHITSFDLEGNKIQSVPAHNYVVYGIDRFNAKLSLSCSRDGSIKIWNAEFSKVLQKIEHKNIGHKHSVNQIIVINAEYFASCSDDRKIKIYKLK